MINASLIRRVESLERLLEPSPAGPSYKLANVQPLPTEMLKKLMPVGEWAHQYGLDALTEEHRLSCKSSVNSTDRWRRRALIPSGHG